MNRQEEDATLRRWQRRSGKVLAEFLADSEKRGLPPLLWTLSLTGHLTGEADFICYTPDERRAAVLRWAEHVGSPVEVSHTDGREELVAGWQIVPRGEAAPVPGCFRATSSLNEENT
ncbi:MULTISPECIES: hypothetical protein [Streptomyces]|uniref:hypothetical protein n=1 Tax=Streptomyces TaxID=1883 RepID=UPI0005B9368E|nr:MULTISPECIES: hypothetical protein [Streptomyces]MDP9954166.1 hypothetical protein [Streptomyces sp. DSM 41269]